MKVDIEFSVYSESLAIYYGPNWALTTADNVLSVKDDKLRLKHTKTSEVITTAKLEQVLYEAGKYVPNHSLKDIYINFDLMDNFCSLDPWDPKMCCYCTAHDKNQTHLGVVHNHLFFINVKGSAFTRALYFDQTMPITKKRVLNDMLEFEKKHKDHVTWLAPQERYGCRGFRFSFVGGKSKSEFLNDVVKTMFAWHIDEVSKYKKNRRGKICLPLILPLSKYKGTHGYHIARCCIDSLATEDFTNFIRRAEKFTPGGQHKYIVNADEWLPDKIAFNAGEALGSKIDLRSTKLLKIKSHAYEKLECANDATDIGGLTYIAKCACGMELSEDNTQHFAVCPSLNDEKLICGCGYELSSAGRWARADHIETCKLSGQVRYCRTPSPN